MCVERPTAVITAVIGLHALANRLASWKHARTYYYYYTSRVPPKLETCPHLLLLLYVYSTAQDIYFTIH